MTVKSKAPWWKINSGFDVGRMIIASIFLVLFLFNLMDLGWTFFLTLAFWGYVLTKNSKRD